MSNDTPDVDSQVVDSKGAEPQAPSEHDLAVDKAKALGWVEQEEYRGDKTKWRDAEEFLDFGERLNPILRENNKRLEAQLRERDQTIAKIQASVEKFAVVHEQTKKAAYEEALKTLRAEKKTALEVGDYDAVIAVDERIAVTRDAAKQAEVGERESAPPIKTAEHTRIEQEFTAWNAQNKWTEDPELEAFAQLQGSILLKEGVDTKGDAFVPFLNKVAERVKARYPEKFPESKRVGASRVEGSSTGGSTGGGRESYAALPAEIKEVCDSLVESIPGYTREKYVKAYYANLKAGR